MCLRTDCAEPLYIAELLPGSRAPVKGAPLRYAALDRVAGGEIIARKKRFGQLYLSSGGILWLKKNPWKGAFTF